MSSNATGALVRTACVTLLAAMTLAGCKSDAAIHSLAMAADAWREMPGAMWALSLALRRPAAQTPGPDCDAAAGS
jgi:hypothetical protein